MIPLDQIIGNNAFQEYKSPCPVRENVKHLQINSFFIVKKPVQQFLSALLVYLVAGRQTFFKDLCLPAAGLQIIPEQSLLQNTLKMRKFPYGLIQRPLQNVRLYLFLQFTGDAENAGIRPHCCGRNNFCRIIQLIPFIIFCHASSPFRLCLRGGAPPDLYWQYHTIFLHRKQSAK